MKTADRRRIRCGQRYYLIQDGKIVSGILKYNKTHNKYCLGHHYIQYWQLKCLYFSKKKVYAKLIKNFNNQISYHQYEVDKNNGIIKLLNESREYYKHKLKRLNNEKRN